MAHVNKNVVVRRAGARRMSLQQAAPTPTVVTGVGVLLQGHCRWVEEGRYNSGLLLGEVGGGAVTTIGADTGCCKEGRAPQDILTTTFMLSKLHLH